MFCVMADECTDITAVDEFPIFCCWVKEGTPVECFLDNVPLKKTDAECTCLALVKCIKDKYLQAGNIVGISFDGAAYFSGRKTGVQARLKKHASHVVFVHCHCHLLQLACVQAANSMTGIKHVIPR